MGMNTGDISRRLGFPVNTEALEAAGVIVGEQIGRATMFSDDWPTICEKLSAYVLTLKSNQPVAKPPPKPKPPSGKPAAAKSPAASPPASATKWENDDDF